MKSVLWIGGGRSNDSYAGRINNSNNYMDSILDYITTAPDLITSDSYVNSTALTDPKGNFGGDVAQFRTAPSSPPSGTVGRHYANYVRLSKLARTNTDGSPKAVQPAGGTAYDPIPYGITEHAMSYENSNGPVHTDAELRNYIAGTQTTTSRSIREAMKDTDILLSIWWSGSSGPNGTHDLLAKYDADHPPPAGKTTNDYRFPLALAAFAAELKRTDVTG